MQILGIPTTDWHGCIGDDFDTIRWTTEPKCTKAQWEIAKTEELAEFTAQAYARNRASAFPSVGDQLDMLMKDMRDGTTTHKTACEAVKNKYPKG